MQNGPFIPGGTCFADALIKLFADDAVWEADGIGRFEGKDEIYGFF